MGQVGWLVGWAAALAAMAGRAAAVEERASRVEGRVVPDLIGSGALCELAAVIVEWHDANPYLKLPVEQLHSIELAHAKMRRAVADGGDEVRTATGWASSLYPSLSYSTSLPSSSTTCLTTSMPIYTSLRSQNGLASSSRGSIRRWS